MKIYAYQHSFCSAILQAAVVASGVVILLIGIVGAWA